MAKKFPLHPKHPERICWGCDKYCPVDALGCGNGSDRTQHPMELLGENWLDYGDWGIETEAEPPRADVDAEKAPADPITDLVQGPAASGGAPRHTMPNPEPTVGDEYRITLCSGELRRWRYLGPDSSGRGWWRDAETLCEFSEDSLITLGRWWRKSRRQPLNSRFAQASSIDP